MRYYSTFLLGLLYLTACSNDKKNNAIESPSTAFEIENPVFAYDKEFDDYADCHNEEARKRKTLIVSHDKFYDDMFYDFPGGPHVSWSGELPTETEKIYIVFYRTELSDDEYNNNPLLYKPKGNITLDEVKAQFPIDPQSGIDFRYVPFYSAHNALEEAMLSSWHETQVHHYADLMFHLRTRFCFVAGG